MNLPGTRGSMITLTQGLIVVAVIIGCLVLLTACAAFDYQWARTRPAAPKPWLVVKVADTDFVCRSLGADPAHQLSRINGCADWSPKGCTIYVPHDAPRWIVEHEQRHCDGWQHN